MLIQSTRHIPDASCMQAFGGKLACAWTTAPRTFRCYLSGDLGTGKTTLVRGVLRELGCKTRIKSPTFALVEPYHLAGKTVSHIDLYRITTPAALATLGLSEYLGDGALCFIEWPDRCLAYLPTPDMHLFLQYNADSRMLKMQAHTPFGQSLWGKFQSL